MPRVSAGILLYRWQSERAGQCPEVFLVHMGGPFWARKDAGAWSIPKGLIDEGEDPLAAALREFREETGQVLDVTNVAPIPLRPVKQAGGKLVYGWTIEGDADSEHIVSNTFRVETSAGSGRWRSYPEADRAAWLSLTDAREKIVNAQRAFLDELQVLVEC